MTPRPLIVLGGIAAVVAVALAASSQTPPAVSPKPARRLPVEVIQVSRVDQYQQLRTYTGIVKASRQSELSFERADELISVAIQEGEHVSVGQVMAQIDAQDLKVRERQLQAQLAEATAVLRELEAGPRKETIAAQRATVNDLASQVAQLERQLQRRQALLDRDAVSREEFEEISYGLDSNRARRDAAQRQLDELIAGTRPERIDAQSAVVQQLEASLDDVRIEIAESTLTAPYDGYVTQRYADEGTIVSPAQPLFRIVEDTELEAWIGLPPVTAASLDRERTYEVRVNDRTYAATVRAVLVELDRRTRTRTVVFRLTSSTPNQVVPGEIARVAISRPTPTQGYWVPTAALTRGSRGLWSVLAVQQQDDAQTVSKRDVEVIHTEGERTLVRGTLVDGDRIVAGGAHRLVVGQEVTSQHR